MIRSLARWCLAGSIGVSSVLAFGCSAAPRAEGEVEQQAMGTLALPLTVVAGDHTYRFIRFSLYVLPQYLWLSASGAADETVLRAELPTGMHQASLSDWALEREIGSGNFAPVQATLLSPSYVNFEILNGSTTTLSFQFETDGQVITVGSGSLNVTARVSERAPVCAVLGSDCGEGAWCPPSELTGAPLACRSAGTVEVGAACAGPAECVANSSCVDFGAGPVCAALCLADALGLPCPSGGTCSAAGSDYGVCGPDAASTAS